MFIVYNMFKYVALVLIGANLSTSTVVTAIILSTTLVKTTVSYTKSFVNYCVG